MERDRYQTEVSRYGKDAGMVKTGKAERGRSADQDHLDLGDDPRVLLCFFIWNTFLYGGIELLVSPETAASVVAIVAGLIFVIWYMRKE